MQLYGGIKNSKDSGKIRTERRSKVHEAKAGENNDSTETYAEKIKLGDARPRTENGQDLQRIRLYQEVGISRNAIEIH